MLDSAPSQMSQGKRVGENWAREGIGEQTRIIFSTGERETPRGWPVVSSERAMST